MITINIQKKEMYLLSAIIVFLVGVGIIIAYNSGADPSIMGHDPSEIGPGTFNTEGYADPGWSFPGNVNVTKNLKANEIKSAAVLIGLPETTTPLAKLHVGGNVYATGTMYSGGMENDNKVCLQDGTNCPISSSANEEHTPYRGGSPCVSGTLWCHYRGFQNVGWVTFGGDTSSCATKMGCRITVRAVKLEPGAVSNTCAPYLRTLRTYEWIGQTMASALSGTYHTNQPAETYYGWAAGNSQHGVPNFVTVTLTPTSWGHDAETDIERGEGDITASETFETAYCNIILEKSIVNGGVSSQPVVKYKAKHGTHTCVTEEQYGCYITIKPV